MCKDKRKKKLFAGSVLIIIGGVLLARNLDLLPFAIPAYVFSWKMFLFVLGALMLCSGRKIWGGLVLMGIASFFMAPEVLGIAHVDLHKFWPLMLILFGLAAIFKKKDGHQKMDWSAQKKSTPDNDELMEATAIFGGENKKISSFNFRGGKITAIFGGMEIDLTNCYLSNERAEIDILAVCGGVTLRVPKEWNVRSEIVPIMGGIEDHITAMQGTYVDPAAELCLKGTAVMGGVEIIRA